MSTITFQCVNCGADYELEIPAIIDKSKAVKCPNCDSKPAAGRVHSFALALEELIGCMAALRTKVRFELGLDTDILPPPYGAVDESEEGGLAGPDDEDEESDDEDFDEDDDADEDLDEEDDDFYDDDDFDDDDDDDADA